MKQSIFAVSVAISTAAVAAQQSFFELEQAAKPDYPSHFSLTNRKYTYLTFGSQGTKVKAIPILNADKILVAASSCKNCGPLTY